MKRSKLFLIVCMLSLAYTSFSQQNGDNLYQEQSQSRVNMINNARSALIDAFLQDDKEKTRELHRQLLENFDESNSVVLFPDEHLLLFVWYGDFESFMQRIPHIRLERIAVEGKILPSFTNNFYLTIRNQVKKELETIKDNLRTSSFTQEEKDFIEIYLQYYFVPNNYIPMANWLYFGMPRVIFDQFNEYDTVVTKINKDTKNFVATYSNSEYIDFLENYENKITDWGGGFGMDIGYAAITGSFSDHFANNTAIGFYLEAIYKKYVMNLGFCGVFGDNRKDIVKSDGLILPKDTTINVNNVYLSLGYKLFEYQRVEIIPMAGIGTTWTRPASPKSRKANPELNQFNYSYGLTASLGIAADIRFGKIRRMPGQDFVFPSMGTMRLSYKFSFNTFKQDIPDFYSGNLHTITVGFRVGGKGIRPVKYK